MSTFEAAIPVILRHEGGWVSNPVDPGGETNYGISTLMLRRLQDPPRGLSNAQVADLLGLPEATLYQPGYMLGMKVEAACRIYRQEFWRYDQISDQTVATKIFDCAVNCGPKRAHVLAQQAGNRLLAAEDQLEADGVLGPKSIAAINGCDPRQYLQAYADEMTAYYQGIVTRHPSQQIFLKIWLHRAAWGL